MHRIIDDTFARPLRRVCALFALVGGAAVALLAFAGAAPLTAAAAHTTPTAAEFAQEFVATANAYAAAHASAARLTNPHCVEASPGRYMCSYAIKKPGRHADCHLMQARWRPEGPSTITVTLAGRAARCESLRAALDSLS
jgi:hypothetical protein